MNYQPKTHLDLFTIKRMVMQDREISLVEDLVWISICFTIKETQFLLVYCFHTLSILTICNEVAKVIILHVSVILFTGGEVSKPTPKGEVQGSGLGGVCLGDVCQGRCLPRGVSGRWGVCLGECLGRYP